MWLNGEQGQGERFQRLLAALDQTGVTRRVLCRESPPIQLAQVQAHILHPPCRPAGLDTNNASLVLRLSYGSIDLLFTGDIEAAGEHALLSAGNGTLASEILKVPHHGSRTSSGQAFVNATAPQVAVASLGDHNRFAFPAPEVVQRYTTHGSRFLRTDEAGAVTVVSDGQSYRVETVLP